ncbi:glycosyltransferase [Roseococcus sp. YIM B11640]|uniref:glycosyltransferase n=1 Tax=Roseococcus sp. YIM B11640 TaxID=3133973 RepID=UPI003C7BD256
MGRQRICLLTLDFVGPVRNGGVGTAFLAAAETFADAGHEVTVLFPPAYSENEPAARWREHYRAHGIDFVSLGLEGDEKECSFGAYQWLKTRSFDAIHFHEMRGIGYWPTVAKRCGLAFADTTLVCQMHGPTLWHFAHSAQYLHNHAEIELDWMERQSCEGADIAIAPSQYIFDAVTEMGWKLPARHRVMPNLMPMSFPIAEPSHEPRPVTELVFFGRLEERKGLGLFCEAVRRLLRAGQRPERITFLGKVGFMDQGLHGLAWLAGVAASWPVPWRVVNDLDPHQARAFLAEPGRLAVIASRMENAPYVVLECLAAGLPFLAPDVGGIGELVDAADHATVLYERAPATLAAAMGRALEHGAAPARPAMTPPAVRELWVEWQGALKPPPLARRPGDWRSDPPLVSVCMAAFNRYEPLAHAVAAVEAQTYPNFEVVLVDDASTDPATRQYIEALKPRFAARGWRVLHNATNSWQGASRRRAAAEARGDYIIFMDDDNAAWPEQIETFVTAAEHSGADILTCQLQPFLGSGPPPRFRSTRPGTWAPIGACPSVGLFWNCFGDNNMFIRRAAWERMGGYTTERVYFEDWEFLQQAVLQGLHLECLPELLFAYRVWDSASHHIWDGASTAHDPGFLYRSYARAARPALDAMPESLRPAMRLMIERDLAGALARREGYFANTPHPTAEQHRIAGLAPNGAEAMIAAAETAFHLQQRETAHGLLEQALRLAPGHPDALRLAGEWTHTSA